MTYPLSSDVSSGQPTASAHYNNLRKDALYLGQASADSLPLGSYLSRHASNLKLEYLATNRIRVAYNAYHPAAIMVGGCMLKAAASIDLPAGYFSGAASLFYIHAIRTPGSTTFTLGANTTPVENETSRVIGTCYWDGTTLNSIISFYPSDGFPQADYDSGWFACAYNNTYTLSHNLSGVPRLVILLHATDAAGTSELIPVYAVYGDSSTKGNIGFTSSLIYVVAANGSTQGCVYSFRRSSGSGYYRVLAWL